MRRGHRSVEEYDSGVPRHDRTRRHRVSYVFGQQDRRIRDSHHQPEQRRRISALVVRPGHWRVQRRLARRGVPPAQSGGIRRSDPEGELLRLLARRSGAAQGRIALHDQGFTSIGAEGRPKGGSRPKGLHYVPNHVTLDRQIDELYQLPLAEFTAARNALAKSIGGADAPLVKALEKPTVVPWAINQLYWRDRAAWDRLMKSGAALRTAQIAALEGKKADVRKAGEAHRQALAEGVERATELAGQHAAKPQAEPLSRMLEALSISATPLPHPGRLTDVIQPAGFEALTGVTPHASPPPPVKRGEAKA